MWRFLVWLLWIFWGKKAVGKHRHHHKLWPTYVRIYINERRCYLAKEIVVGQSAKAKVVVFDQFGRPYPFDFAASVPVWGSDQTSNIGLSAGDTPDSEIVTGVAVTAVDAILSVSVPGVGTATTPVAIIAAPVEEPVATSVQIVFE
jgi:hypothetical protein